MEQQEQPIGNSIGCRIINKEQGGGGGLPQMELRRLKQQLQLAVLETLFEPLYHLAWFCWCLVLVLHVPMDAAPVRSLNM